MFSETPRSAKRSRRRTGLPTSRSAPNGRGRKTCRMAIEEAFRRLSSQSSSRLRQPRRSELRVEALPG